MSRIYVIHENDAWVEPLRAAFAELRPAVHRMVHRRRASSISTSVPPQGVFYNRMSASSHTRGHRYAAELTGGRARVARVARPARRSTTAARCSSRSARSRSTRRSRATASASRARSPPSGRDAIVEARESDARPLHHQAQPRRQGPRRAALRQRRRARALRRQRRVRGFGRRHHADPAVHRRARALHHARRVRRRQIPLRGARRHVARLRAVPGGRRARSATRSARSANRAAARPRRRGFASSTASRTRSSSATGASSRDNGIGIAGIEFITDRNGELYTYDVNTNTNYNSDAERDAGMYGMRAIASYLGDELRALDRQPAGPSARPRRSASANPHIGAEVNYSDRKITPPTPICDNGSTF